MNNVVLSRGYFSLVILISYLISASANPDTNVRISAKKCEEYKEIYREHFKSPLPPPFNFSKIGDLACPKLEQGNIVGGRDAILDEFPHMASLQYSNEGNDGVAHECGATLISEQYLLTAAHCINGDRSPEKVILGDILLVRNKKRKGRKEMGVEKIIVHPKYHPEESRYHDIALIKLDTIISLNPSSRPEIRPACLGQSGQTKGLAQVTATGWGRISEDSDISNNLKVANFTVEENGPCQKVYSEEIHFPQGIASELMCAGEVNKDTCKGDSGGPLTIKPIADLPCMDYIVGITSVGPDNCGQGTPGIYTRVEKYIDWIEDNVWNNP